MVQAKKNRSDQGKDRSRQKILKAAFELFAQKGYAKTSVDSIARKARVSKGLIYHYFQSKVEILKGVFVVMKKEGDRLYDEIDTSSPESFLNDMIELSTRYVEQQGKTVRLTMALAVQPEVMKDLQDEMEAVRNEWIGRVTRVFEALQYPQPEAEAYLFCATLDGLGMGYTVMAAGYPLEEVKKLIREKYKIA